MRDSNGRFVKGTTGNPAGRPKRQVEEEYFNATMACIPIQDWQQIVRKAITQAKRGDYMARQWLSDHVLGKPTQRQEIGGFDGNPIEINDARDRLAQLLTRTAERSRTPADSDATDATGSGDTSL